MITSRTTRITPSLLPGTRPSLSSPCTPLKWVDEAACLSPHLVSRHVCVVKTHTRATPHVPSFSLFLFLSLPLPISWLSQTIAAQTQLQWATSLTLVHFLFSGVWIAFPRSRTASLAAKMVLFVDLEDDAEPPERPGVAPHWSQLGNGVLGGRSLSSSGINGLDLREVRGEAPRENPNNNAVTQALGCYPYVSNDVSRL